MTHPDWVLGVQDEVWWSRLSAPGLHAWAEDDQPLRLVEQAGAGVRIVNCYLPVKSPWLNPIEPFWLHAKRRVVEPARLLSAADLIDRVCAALDCPHDRHVAIPHKVA